MSLREITTGWLVFAKEGAVAIGGVRRIQSDQLVIHIEGFGETNITAGQIKSAHDGKVILDLNQLSDDLKGAIERAHTSEKPS